MTYDEYMKKYHNTSKEDKEEKKQEKKPQSSYQQYMQKYGQVYQSDFSSKGSSMLQDFSSAYRSFVETAKSDFKTLGYANARDMQTAAGKNAADLRNRVSSLKSYFAANRSYMSDKDYTDAISFINSASSTVDSAMSQYNNSLRYYSQFATQKDYDDYVTAQKDYEGKASYDLDAAQKEIDELEAKVAELKRSGNPYLTDNPVQATSPYAAGLQRNPNAAADQEIRDLDTLISQKRAYMNQAKYIQEGIALSGVNDPTSKFYDPEFGDLSSVNGEVSDAQYRWINDKQYRSDALAYTAQATTPDLPEAVGKQEQAQAWLANNGNPAAAALASANLNFMSEDEVGIYNYYYAKGGKEAAQKYLDSIQETLNYRKATSMYKSMEGNTALELLFGVEAGLDQFASGVKNLFNTEDDYIAQTAIQMASGMVREDLADNGPKLPQWMGGASLGQVGYDAITTTTNMAPSMLTSMAVGVINPAAGAALGTGLMGASAAGNAYQEALNMGYGKGQARVYSTLIGASEAGLQYLLGGLGKLGGKLPAKALKMLDGIDNAFARTALKLGGSMLSEGFEEGLQEVLTPLFKNWALQANEEINWGEVAYSGLLGALTAGFMEGPSTIAGEVKTYKQGKQLQKKGFTGRLKEVGSLFAADTVAYKLAGKVNENTGAYTIGRLFNEVGATLTEQNVSDITEALVAKGMDEKTARKNAEAVAAIVDGGNLTDLQVAVIESNDVLAEAVRTTIVDPNATWFQRSKGYNEALMALAQEKTSPKAKQTQQPLSGQENATFADKVGTQHENGAEAAPAADVTSAKVKSIASISDGKVMLKLEDGSEVEAASADLDPEDGVIIETIAKIGGISANDANYILGMIKAAPGVNPQWSALGASEVYRYGFYGMSRDHITKHGVFSISLTDAQRNAIYEAGRNARNATVQSKTQRITENATANATADKNAAVAYEKTATGKVHFEGDRNALTHRQKASLTAMEKIADVLGVQIHVFESEVGKSGKRIGANGWYDPRDNSIHIDLHAGANGEGTMLFTLAHELTHHIRKWSPAKFKVLSDFLMEEYGKKGVNVDALVHAQMDKAWRTRKEKLSYDAAFEEVVADSMEMMLSDGNVMKRLEKLKAKDKDLWHKIKSFIDELAEKIRSIYKGLKPDSVEGQYVADMGKAVYRLQELFAEALVDASENYQSSITPGEGGVAINQNGDPVAYSTEDGSVLLSMRTYEEDGRDAFRNYLQKCVTSNKLTKTEMQEMLNGIENIYQTCKEFKDKYAPFGAWSDAAVVRDTHGRPVFSVVTPNGDYKMNLDFSLVCKKRRTLDAVFNEMARRGIIDDFELGQKSVVKINEIIRKYGLETACALCFVDAKRFRQASMADSFTKLYNELVLSLVPEDQKGSIDHFNFSGYDTIKKVEGGIHTWDSSKLDFSHLDKVMRDYGKGTVEHKAAKYIKSHAEGRKLLLRGDFMSSHGFDAVKTQNRDILRLYNSKKGTGGPKAAFGDVQYMNEIIKKARTWTPAKAYSVGGVRIQSFSDYVPRMVFDYTQMIYDLAATKLPAHAYTKEALFVKQFGLTGVKINMSLIPAIAEDGIAPGLDANGNYVWAGESFDYETAKEIQNAEGYTENCGTICVGVSYDHIMKLLRDPNIRMVIPYHKSGLNPIVAHMNKIAQFRDYTNDQRTKDKSGKALDKDFDFSKALHDMGDNASPKAVADQYLKWCADPANGYTPRFAEFAMEDNYYKLLEDFTLYDKDGNYVPQREVRAVFPKADSAFGSMKDLIEAGLEEDAVVEGKRDSSLSAIVDEIQKTLPRAEAEIAEEQVAQADRDLEAEVKYSSRDYSAQVDEVKNNTHDRNNHVYMGTTPTAITKVLDLPKLPMLITSQHIYSMAVSKAQAQQEGRFKSRYNYHNLGWDAVKKLPEGINKPVLIIKSNTDPNDATFVVVTAQVDNAGNPIIAAVKPNGRGNYFNIEFPTNFVLSGYGKDGIHGYVARAKTENRILYANKNSQKTKNTTSVQFADNILSSDYTANLARFKGIVKSKFVGTIFENSGLPKFSDRDSDGNALSSGQKEFFKDSVVRDNNGSLMVMYHGTANGGAFTVFDGDRLGNEARTSQIGQGFYFTNAKAEAESYTTNVDIYGRSSKGDNPYLHQVYLNITNPFNVAEDELNLDDVKALYGDGTYDYFFTNWVPFCLNRKSVNGEVLTKSAVQAMSKSEKVSLYVDYLAQLGTKALLSNMVRAFPYGKQGELLAAMKNRLGYDGIVEEYAPGKYQYVAFSSEQIKLVDNKNPTGDSDIRYSDRDTESVSNRSLLANAFEGVAQNEIEAKKIGEYKSKIDLMDAEERKLRELNAQIKELSFAKGKRDTQKIRELREEAIKTRNRIGIYDSQLLRLEASKPLQAVLAREKKKAYQRAEQKGKEALDAYRLKAEAKQSEILRDYREANATLRGQQSDAAIMEKEFVRIVKAYERLEAQSTAKSGKDARTIADLRSALREESKKRNADQKTWEAEFDRLLREYEASDRNIAKLEEKIERQRANAKAKIESREKTAMRHKIQAFKARLESSLLRPSDRRYIPIDLIKAMVEVCDLIGTDTQLHKADGSINKAQEKRNLTKERLQNLKDEYEKLKTHSDPIYAGEFDEMVYAYLTELRDNYAGKTLNEMSLDDLKEMYEILRAIEETLQDARKLIGWGDAESAYEAGDAIVAEQNAISKSRKNSKRNAAQKVRDASLNLSLSPVRNVERMSGYNGDSALLKLFKKFEQGIRKKNKFVMEAYKNFEGLTSSKEYENAMYTEMGGKKYTDIKGRKFGISKMQMMQAILSYEREVANNLHHIENGGFTFADLDMLRKGKLKDAISAEYSHRVPAAVNLVAEFNEALKNDQWCQDYMAAARKFFDGAAKDAINETGIALKHRIIAKDKNYIPFEVDKNFIIREISAANDVQQTINSYGMLKDVKDGAPQPLIITGLNNVLDRHIDMVGNVYGLAVEVRNYNKVWNLRSGNNQTVKEAIETNWGEEGVAHIEQAVQDIQGPRIRERNALYNKVKSNYISATFLLNLSVVTKQIGSLFSATSMLRWRGPVRQIGNLVWTMVNHKKIAAEVDKYTATAWMRRQGLSDAELHTLLTQAKKPGLFRLWEKAPAAINPAKWITAMDSAVALSLWKYAKQDTAKRTGLKGEELLKATAEFYDEVVENTQSMTDVLHRPEIQKRSDILSESFAMFKTDLYQMAGQLQVTAGRFTANRTKENGMALGRTLYAITMSAVWGQLMTTVFALLRYKVNHYRDEEDEELTYESWLNRQGFSFAGDLMGYIFPIFGSETIGVFENIMYGESDDIVDSIALTAINDLYDMMITVGSSFKEGEMPEPAKMKQLTIKALQVFGIPANNIIRTYEAIHLHAKDVANGKFLSFEAGVDRSPKHHIHRIMEAMDEGKIDVAIGLYEEALEETAMGKTEDGSYGRAELKDAESSLKSALGDKFKDGEVSGALTIKILTHCFGLGRDEAERTVREWAFRVDHGFSYSDQKQQFMAGNITASEVRSNIMAVEGKTEEEAESRIVGYCRDAYEEGYFTRSEAASAMIFYGGMDKSEAEDKLRYIDVRLQFSDTYVDDAWVDEYYKEVESSGISIEVFVDYRNRVKDITGDGKKERRMAVIDSLPISDEQKDALYFAEGWAASKIDEAPWHR